MDFVQKFHDLQGTSTSELSHSFNKFRLEIENLPQNELSALLDQITPNNLQEQLFHVQLLLEHGTYKELERILFQGNRVLNRKLTNSLHFIKHVSKIPPKEFCERICPEISYVTKVRIINKLPKVVTDAKVGEAYFKAVKDRYGVRVASNLITSCGETFILKTLDELEIKLNDRQLMVLHIKYPNFVHAYFNDTRSLNNHKKFAQKLAVKDVGTFCILIKYGIPSIGKKASLYFVKQYKSKILANPDFYKEIVKAKVANSVFTLEESIQFLQKQLPESIDDYYLSYNDCRYLKAMPSKVRGKIIFTAFRNNFGFEMDNNYLRYEGLEFLTLEERKKIKLDEDPLKYGSPNEVIPLIKEKMRFAGDVIARIDLTSKLLQVCKENRDHAALLDVLKYFCTHHKNDVIQLRQSFISKLRYLFKLEMLSEEHWKYINDILMMCEINNDQINCISEIIESRIQYKYLNGLDYEEDAVKLLKLGSWDIEAPNIRRNFILIAAEYLKGLPENTKDEDVHQFFEALTDYNATKNSNPIHILEYNELLTVFFNEFEDNKHKTSKCLKEVMKSVPQNSAEEAVKSNLIKRYFETAPNSYKSFINVWFLKNDISVVESNAEAYFDKEKFVLRNEFYYEASKIPIVAHKFCEVAENILNSNDDNLVASIPIALKYLAFKGMLLKVAAKFRPSGDYNIDVYEDNIRTKLVTQKGVLNAIRNVAISNTCISEVISYCKGEYFVYAMKALYTTMYNMPEKLIYAPIDVLMKGKLSIKEQAIYLLCNLSTSRHVRKVLRSLGDSEIDKVLGKFLFKRTFNGLADYPDDDFFALLVKQFDLLDTNDDESFKLMLELYDIPKRYIGAYIKVMWDHAEAHGLECQVLSKINIETWNKLERNLCETILKSTLYNEKNYNSMTELVYEYLLHGGELQIIYSSGATDRQIFAMIKYITEKIILDNERKELRLQLATKLLDSADSIPVTRDKFPLQIRLESAKFFMDIEGEVVTPMVHYLVHQQNVAVQKYGPAIASYFRDFAVNILYLVIRISVTDSKNRDNKMTLLKLDIAEKIAESSNTTESKLLALELVPKKIARDEKFLERRKQVYDCITNDRDPAIDVYMADMYYTGNI